MFGEVAVFHRKVFGIDDLPAAEDEAGFEAPVGADAPPELAVDAGAWGRLGLDVEGDDGGVAVDLFLDDGDLFGFVLVEAPGDRFAGAALGRDVVDARLVDAAVDDLVGKLWGFGGGGIGALSAVLRCGRAAGDRARD